MEFILGILTGILLTTLINGKGGKLINYVNRVFSKKGKGAVIPSQGF